MSCTSPFSYNDVSGQITNYTCDMSGSYIITQYFPYAQYYNSSLDMSYTLLLNAYITIPMTFNSQNDISFSTTYCPDQSANSIALETGIGVIYLYYKYSSSLIVLEDTFNFDLSYSNKVNPPYNDIPYDDASLNYDSSLNLTTIATNGNSSTSWEHTLNLPNSSNQDISYNYTFTILPANLLFCNGPITTTTDFTDDANDTSSDSSNIITTDSWLNCLLNMEINVTETEPSTSTSTSTSTQSLNSMYFTMVCPMIGTS